MNIFKYTTLILSLLCAAPINGATQVEPTIIPGAAYYIIHSDQSCEIPSTFDYEKIMKITGSMILGCTFVDRCHWHSVINPSLQHQKNNHLNPCVVSFHDSSCKMITMITNLPNNKETQLACHKKLDPCAKRKAISGTLSKCWKTGTRLLSFYDSEKNCICTIKYTGKNVLSDIKAAPHLLLYRIDTTHLKYIKDYTAKGTWNHWFGKKITQ